MKPMEYRWAHAVNSVALLEKLKQEILSSKPSSNHFANAVEADIIWSSTKQAPVMGHPPQTDGDLSFQAFLSEMTVLASHFLQPTWSQNHTQISTSSLSNCAWTSPLLVKLDFKSMHAFESSCHLLRSFIGGFPFQHAIFINADILVGPSTSSAIAFKAPDFLKLATSLACPPGSAEPKHANKIVLSLGWTTSNNTTEEQALCYTDKMIDEMLQMLKEHNSASNTFRVTFPVRSTCFRDSWPALQRLLDIQHPNHGLTIWWSAFAVPNDLTDWFLSTLEDNKTYADRTFYDLKGFQSPCL